MRRRLIAALVGVALASVLLVGAGILLLAQFGAREQAGADVEARLEALTELLADTSAPQRGLSRARQALDFSQLTLVVVTAGGDVVELGSAPSAGGPPGGRVALQLSDQDLAAFLAGESVVVTAPDDDGTVVRGLRLIESMEIDGGPGLRANRLADGDGSFGLMATQPVVAVPRRAQVWFALSAGVVVAASLVVARGLSRRLVRPIDRIQRTTAAIAGGDLGARVDVDGDDELADLGRSVNLMATELERSRAADQQFLLSVSHDLRTPLTAISGYAEALRDGAVDDPSRAGGVIGHHAGRLERLVGDLLDLAKLDADRFTLHLQRLDVVVVVGRAVAGRVPVAERHAIDLRFEPAQPAPADIDADRLAQVVDNVVDNALTFASSSVTVSVTPPPSDSPGDPIRIAVADDGPGIPAEDLPHVFERLYVSASQPARSENPSGLGLAIVRELIGAMGGTVSASSPAGGGTTITIALPSSSGSTTPP